MPEAPGIWDGIVLFSVLSSAFVTVWLASDFTSFFSCFALSAAELQPTVTKRQARPQTIAIICFFIAITSIGITTDFYPYV